MIAAVTPSRMCKSVSVHWCDKALRPVFSRVHAIDLDEQMIHFANTLDRGLLFATEDKGQSVGCLEPHVLSHSVMCLERGVRSDTF